MGYYTQIVESNIFIDKKDFPKIYEKMCELNDYHELKRGGSFGSNTDSDPNERYPKNKWFSWMDYNYPETCKTMEEILIQVGFELSFDDDGNLVDLSYSNKTGNEDYFLNCFAGYAKEGDYIIFKGEEDSDYYRFVFSTGKMIGQSGEVQVNWKFKEVYTFGQMSEDDKATALWREEWNKKQEEKKEANV